MEINSRNMAAVLGALGLVGGTNLANYRITIDSAAREVDRVEHYAAGEVSVLVVTVAELYEERDEARAERDAALRRLRYLEGCDALLGTTAERYQTCVAEGLVHD